MVRDEYNHSRPVSALIRDWLLYSKAGGGGGILKTVTGNPISISDALAAPIKSLSVSLSPIQEGSGDPSPENVRPITGRDEVTVTRTNQNLWDDRAFTDVDNPLTIEDDATSPFYGWYKGSINKWAASVSPSSFCKFPAGAGRLTVSLMGGNASTSSSFIFRVYFAYDDGTTDYPSGNITYGPQEKALVTRTSTEGKNCIAYRITTTGGANNMAGRIQYVYVHRHGDESEYAPSDIKQVTIQLGQTVYGGTVDVTGGKVRVTDAIFTLDGSENDWYLQTAKDTETIYRTYALKTKGIAEFSKANYCTAYTAAIVNMPVNTVKFLPSTEGAYVCLAQSTLADFKAFLSANPLQIDCKLAEPFDIDIDPATLSTLKGQNNVWSDGDDVTMTYIADPKLYIQKVVSG